jgi:hypothetical protein
MRESRSGFKKVAVSSGHMIDKPDRPSERFPPHKEPAVREHIAKQLAAWNIAEGDLAICGAARGADILVAEVCAGRGATVWLFVPLPEGEFLDESVRLPGSNWEERYLALRRHPAVQTYFLHEHFGKPAQELSAFAQNNLWMIDAARREAHVPSNLFALLVWDEKPTGDGPGGTSDFAARIREIGGQLAVINPTKL